MPNTLYFGDNLPVMHDRLADESVDLIYLDPPFNSNRAYNVLFQDESGIDSQAQITAFGDTWHWDHSAEVTYLDLMRNAPQAAAALISAMRQALGINQTMAYLVMMSARLVELHRILKPTGSLYLHCDPTASHYLKLVLDSIFGAENFRNEIIWQRTSAHNDSKKWGRIHDTILYYTRTSEFTWNPTFTAHDPQYVRDFYRHHDERGVYRLDHVIRSTSMGPRPNLVYEYKGYTPEWGWRVVREKLLALDAENRLAWSKSGRPYLKRYLNEQHGTPITSVITDIPPIGARAAERLGYPTQKPLALLERIIQASSKPGDVIFDPFCGCGTAIIAAQKLGRQWIGIDITYIAISLIRNRIKDMYPDAPYAVIGLPEDLHSARQLAQLSEHDGRYQFQYWALSLVQARPVGRDVTGKAGKKGADRGIDGIIPFIDDSTERRKQILVQVKSGHVKSGDIRDLRGVLEREKAEMGVFITLETPSAEMQREVATAGFYYSTTFNKDYPRLQILTIEALLNGAEVKMPPTRGLAFKRVARADEAGSDQLDLGV